MAGALRGARRVTTLTSWEAGCAVRCWSPRGACRERARVLFLSGSVGKGHDDIAAAFTAGLDHVGVESKTLDTMRLLGPIGYPPVHWIEHQIYVSFPFLFDALYFSQFRLDNGIGKWMTNGMVRGTQRRLRYELDNFVPDVVVPVFNPAAPVVSHLRRSGYSFRTIVYAPGSFADRWWVQETTDLFLVSSRVAAASIRRFWPEARVEVITDPLRPEYWAAPSQEEARASLGIPPGVPCALVVCGSLGHGRPDLIAKELAEDGLWVIVAGGTNDTLVKRLRG